MKIWSVVKGKEKAVANKPEETLKTNYHSRVWNEESDNMLISVVKSYGKRKVKWSNVGKILGKNRKQCYSRFLRIKPGVVRGKWTSEEDEIVKKHVKRHGKKWAVIARMMKKRSGKQIRDRFNNYLDPDVIQEKTNKKEDQKPVVLLDNQSQFMSLVAPNVPEKTEEDSLKICFNCFLKNKPKIENTKCHFIEEYEGNNDATSSDYHALLLSKRQLTLENTKSTKITDRSTENDSLNLSKVIEKYCLEQQHQNIAISNFAVETFCSIMSQVNTSDMFIKLHIIDKVLAIVRDNLKKETEKLVSLLNKNLL